MEDKNKAKLRQVAFLHPDLGIGGAERLIVDAALALKKADIAVTIFTSHHDSNHCFPETRNEFEVIVAGDWLPRSTFGRFKALWAYVRMVWLTFWFALYFNNIYDVVICDIISLPHIILYLIGQKSIFYCHFPDQLLTKRESFIKKIYRWPIDWLEGIGIACADITLVNSLFTKKVFHATFSSLHIEPKVLYPTVNFSAFDKKLTGSLDIQLSHVETLFLSINRYERKKKLGLAIDALNELYNVNNLNDIKSRSSIHLIIAGGYDPLNIENIQHYEELRDKTQKLNIEANVTFLKSPSDEQKQLLLHSCTAVIYTPENEHFGIVPLEAMYMSRPVIATNTGGPLETVIDSETGFLCPPNVVAFSEAMNKFVKDKSLSREMGTRGHEHVAKKFNFKTFQTQLLDTVNSLFN